MGGVDGDGKRQFSRMDEGVVDFGAVVGGAADHLTVGVSPVDEGGSAGGKGKRCEEGQNARSSD